MGDRDKVRELETEVARLRHELAGYRTVAEDTLVQLDWCIGYFTRTHKPEIASELSANRVHIRREFMRRASQPAPAPSDDKTA